MPKTKDRLLDVLAYAVLICIVSVIFFLIYFAGGWAALLFVTVAVGAAYIMTLLITWALNRIS